MWSLVRNRELKSLLLSVWVVCHLNSSLVQASDYSEPWSVNLQAPVLNQLMPLSSVESDNDVPEEMGRSCSYAWLKIYQNYFSVVSKSHCPMYPSCSNYSIQAIRRYGSIKGIIMTADRLIHESTEMREAPVIQVGERTLCFDPVE